MPFYLDHKYMNDMGWEKKVDKVKDYLFTRDALDPQLVDRPAHQVAPHPGRGAVPCSASSGSGAGWVFWLMAAVTFALLFVYMPEGRLWNARLLPFYYLARTCSAAIGIAEIGLLVARSSPRRTARPRAGRSAPPSAASPRSSPRPPAAQRPGGNVSDGTQWLRGGRSR